MLRMVPCDEQWGTWLPKQRSGRMLLREIDREASSSIWLRGWDACGGSACRPRSWARFPNTHLALLFSTQIYSWHTPDGGQSNFGTLHQRLIKRDYD